MKEGGRTFSKIATEIREVEKSRERKNVVRKKKRQN